MLKNPLSIFYSLDYACEIVSSDISGFWCGIIPTPSSMIWPYLGCICNSSTVHNSKCMMLSTPRIYSITITVWLAFRSYLSEMASISNCGSHSFISTHSKKKFIVAALSSVNMDSKRNAGRKNSTKGKHKIPRCGIRAHHIDSTRHASAGT